MSRVSVIIPFLNEAENIPNLFARLAAVGEKLPDADLEIVFVDDGSTDGSDQIVRDLPTTGPSIQLVRLSRNFGSHAALAAGVAHATGDLLTFMSADLQDPPEILLALLAKSREGHEIVWGQRLSRKDPWSTRAFAWVYYSLLRRYALPNMPLGGVDLCLFDRRVVEGLGDLQEKNSNIFCLLMWSGFSQAFVPYERGARTAGESKWTMSKRIKLFTDSFVAFSFLPIRAISLLGGLVSLFGLGWASLVIARTILIGSPVEGWPALLSAVLILSGVQLLALSVLSEYLWRSLDVARNRPLYVVREAVTVGDPSDQPASKPAGAPPRRAPVALS